MKLTVFKDDEIVAAVNDPDSIYYDEEGYLVVERDDRIVAFLKNGAWTMYIQTEENNDPHPVLAVARFMELGGQEFPEDTDWDMAWPDLKPFLARVKEEVQEIKDSRCCDNDFVGHEALDGFLDVAYAALTGAVRLVGREKAARAWDLVVDANLAKVDGRFGPPVINEETGKIGKPEGWQAPDIEGLMHS